MTNSILTSGKHAKSDKNKYIFVKPSKVPDFFSLHRTEILPLNPSTLLVYWSFRSKL